MRGWTCLLWLCVLLCGPATPGAAWALPVEELIVSRGYLEDPDGQLGIDDVAQRAFTPFDGRLSRGFVDSAYWVRLEVRAPAQGSEVVLRIYPANLDDVQLFEAAGNGWRQRAVGDHHASALEALDGPTFTFPVRVTQPGSKTFYLRLHTTSLSQLGLEALTPGDSHHRDRQIDLLQVVFMGLILWTLTWALQHYFTDRDPLVGLFAVYLVAFIFYEAALSGYLAMLVPPGWADGATNVSVCTWTFTATVLTAFMLRRYEPPRAYFVGCAALLLTYPLELALLGTGHTRHALALNAMVTVGSRLYFLAMALAARRDASPRLRHVQAMLAVVAVMVIFAVASEVGWLTVTDSTLRRSVYLIAFGLLSCCLLVVLVRARLEDGRRRARQTALDLALAQQALALERRHREEAQQLACTDFLTGLPNRRHFMDVAAAAVEQALLARAPLAVVAIDIDHFQTFNDAMGHGHGDQILQRVALLLRGALRDGDVLARVGGEEFAAVLIGADASQALDRARQLRSAVAASAFVLDDAHRVQVSVCLGLALLNGRAATLSTLLSEAGQALNSAKAAGRNTERLHDQEIGADVRRRARMAQALATAIEANQLSIDYQPVIDARSGDTLSAEALLRWRHPVFGDVPPEEFVPVAEDSALILTLGGWVLEQACLEASRWPAPLKVSVNVSTLQLRSGAIVAAVREALARSGLPAHRLELEITESALAEAESAAATLTALHDLGVSLALDDFGTGFSSLSYLRHFPFDRLKIDRSFVRSLRPGGERAARALAQAVIDLARALKVTPIAEGIETADQLCVLRDLGCDAVQGFHIARPMDGSTIRRYLSKREATAVPQPLAV